MSHFRLYTELKEKGYLRYLLLLLVCVTAAGSLGYLAHIQGTARAKSRETVLIFTEEELEQYLLDQESEEYNLSGRYRLEADLDLSGLKTSIGTNAEPFTGTLDGNGHVIRGLARPLFGVMKNAEAVNLYFSDVVIDRPFTYRDGETYVDGYGALAAYAVDSVIQNCGMNGKIYTASPAEAEFLLEKASPSEAEEEKTKETEESSVESSPVMDGGEGGSMSGGSGGAAGPGVESSHETDNAETDDTAEIGPGIESTEESETEKPTESSAQENTGTDTPPAEDESGNGNEGSTSKAEESESTGDGEQDGGAAKPSEPDHAAEGTEHSTDVSSGEHSGETEHETDIAVEETKSEAVEETKEAATQAPSEKGEVPAPDTQAGAEKETAGADTEVGVQSNSVDSHTGGTGGNDPLAETIGFRTNNRQSLMMKIPEVAVPDMDVLMTASPADATPSDAEEPQEEIGPGKDNRDDMADSGSDGPGITGGSEEKGIQEEIKDFPYIMKSNGDIYIIVTAERITAGGLIAETAGETLISGSFALATIGSQQENMENYVGGLTAILGVGSRAENSYASGISDGDGVTGGFAAVNQGTIENSYSVVTVGDSGASRGAFTALESGRLIGCVYDRQMACAGEGEIGEMSQEPLSTGTPTEVSEFSLIGLPTSQLIGPDSQMPGTWRKTENAYPQLEYFAFHEDKAVSSSSKASVIALVLPEELTLEDVVKNGDVILPSEVDGEAVVWEAEGNIKIDEKNQVVAEERAEIISGEPVMLKSALSQREEPLPPSSQEPTAENRTEPTTENQTEPKPATESLEESESATETLTEPEPAAPTEEESSARQSDQTNQNTVAVSSGFPRLTAQINGTAKTFQLNVAPRATYKDWDSVIKAYGWNEAYLRSHTVTLPDGKVVPMLEGGDGSSEAKAYKINSAEAFVWFGYNASITDAFTNKCIILGADIDLSGVDYGGSKDTPLRLTAIASSYPLTGVIDGAGHTVDYVNIEDGGSTPASGVALFCRIYGGTLKNFTLGKHSRITSKISSNGILVGGLVAGAYGTFDNCYNYASVTGYRHVAGLAAGFYGTTTMTRCGNYGTVTAGLLGAGITSYIGTGNPTLVSHCFNAGNISTTLNNADAWVAGICPANDYSEGSLEFSKRFVNCYNSGKITSAMGKSYQSPLVHNVRCKDSYYDKTMMPDEAVSAYHGETKLTTEQMKSWGLAYALNGQTMEGVWKYNKGEFPNFGTLDPPASWSDVGQGILDGLVTVASLNVGNGSASSPYQISNAEQLAAFAAKVNTTEPGACGTLTANIDLTGARFHGTESNPILWAPMGTGIAGNLYTGTFLGKGNLIYNMKVKTDGYAGLFGCIGRGASISKLGLDKTCSVEAVSPGTSGLDGTAGFVGVVKKEGQSNGSVIIQDCYNRARIQGKSAKTAAFIGSDESVTGMNVQIKDCYTTGTMATASGAPGVLIGSSSGNANVSLASSYWDTLIESGYGGLPTVRTGFKGTAVNCSGMKTDMMKSQTLANLLNSTEVDWKWDSKKNNAYPSFAEMRLYTSWLDVGGVSLEPVAASGENKGTASNPYLIWSPEDLAWVSYQVSNGRPNIHAKLMTDISLFGGIYTGGNAYESDDTEILSRGLSWYPIGSIDAGKNYTGTFDGNGHEISKIHLTGNIYQGLFGVLGTGAVVKNTEVKTILSSASNASFIGGIAAYANGTGVKITECANRGSLTAAGSSIGGCLGYTNSSSEVVVEGCYNGEDGIIDIKGSLVGGIVGEGSGGTVTVRNCYNRGRVLSNSIDVGGITGNAAKIISGCYNAGQVTGGGSTRVGGITGISASTASITNCLVLSSATSDVKAIPVTLDQLKTWGAAFHMNGQKVSQATGMSWEFETGKNGNFPYLTRESPKGADEWDTVMEGVDNGLITITKPTGATYQISSAEQLAWFAYRVNHGSPSQSAVLVKDIDMKKGEERYIPSGRLSWTPAGRRNSAAAVAYTGSFGSLKSGDTGAIWKIQNLYCNSAGTAGLFGRIGTGGTVSGIGMVNADITGTGETQNMAGAITGENYGGTISRCYFRKEGSGTSRVSVAGGDSLVSYCGGIMGYGVSGSKVVDCYSLDTAITATGVAVVGGITGNLSPDSSVKNSYSALESGGKLEVEKDAAGSIQGTGRGSVTGCFREKAYPTDPSGIQDFGAVSGTNRQTQTNALNTLNGSSERTGSNRSWYTSLASEVTRGLPTLEAPKIVTVTINPADTQNGRSGTLSSPVPAAVYRGIREEVPGDITPLPLTVKTEISSKFYTMGTDNANKKVGLASGAGTDLSTLTGSLTSPTASTGALSSLTLYTGGAYTYQKQRLLLVDVAVSGVRYEIQVTIPGVTSKLLNVTLPVKVGIEDLAPTGSRKLSYSADLKLTNNNNYPVKGSVLRLTPITGDGYVTLKPVAKTDNYGSTKQLADPNGGVKVGITDTKTPGSIVPSAGIYYTPAKNSVAETWVEYQIKGKGVLPYRYFIEYEANPYYSDTNQYGYTASYSFGIPKEDMTSSAAAVVK